MRTLELFRTQHVVRRKKIHFETGSLPLAGMAGPGCSERLSKYDTHLRKALAMRCRCVSEKDNISTSARGKVGFAAAKSLIASSRSRNRFWAKPSGQCSFFVASLNASPRKHALPSGSSWMLGVPGACRNLVPGTTLHGNVWENRRCCPSKAQ